MTLSGARSSVVDGNASSSRRWYSYGQRRRRELHTSRFAANTIYNPMTTTNMPPRVVTVVMAVSALVFSIMAWNIPQVNA
jgi:hypothetical protein